MQDKPVYVADFIKPKNTEIKRIGNNYYLYERHSVYDSSTKRMRKKSGRCIGKITEGGLVESTRRMVSARSSSASIRWEDAVDVEYGASKFLYDSCSGIIGRLKRHFPDHWREIFAMAALRCMGTGAFRRYELAYQTSYLHVLLGRDVDLTTRRLSKELLIDRIGASRGAMIAYMKEDIAHDGGFMLIDGHRIISRSALLEDAQLGYDSKMRHTPQISILYMFRVDGGGKGGMPAFYSQFSGSVPDCTALPQILKESGIDAENVTVVADKGFCGSEDFESIAEAGLKSIIPIRRGAKDVEIPKSLDGYDGTFTHSGRTVMYKSFPCDGYVLHLYYDMLLANSEALDLVERRERQNAGNAHRREIEAKRRKNGKGRLSDAELSLLEIIDPLRAVADRSALGTFILRTDRIDLSPSDVYRFYKNRQDIEQSFKAYDNDQADTGSYMRTHQGMECWLFINHLALQMEYMILNGLSDSRLSSRYSFKDAMQLLKSVRAVRHDGEWHICNYTKKTKAFCEKLGLTLSVDTPDNDT